MTHTTTLNRIKAARPCADGWAKLLRHLGKIEPDDEPLPFETILDSNGLADALWCCRSAPEYDRDWRLYAVWCARQVECHLTDPRSRAALDVAERFARGEATTEELAAARSVAIEAADAARSVAYAAAAAAAWSVWSVAAYAAARSADSAVWVAGSVAAARSAQAAQADMFRRVCRGTAPWQEETRS
jgi:hypothetical protein